MQELVLNEPLVEHVSAKNVCTDMVPMFAIDLYTVEADDLNFSSQVQLPVLRDDYCHGLVSFFEVEFTKCNRRTGFSTGPHCKRTHWKQTLFYLTQDLLVSQGTKIDVAINVNRHAQNRRSLEINIEVSYGVAGENCTQKRDYVMK